MRGSLSALRRGARFGFRRRRFRGLGLRSLRGLGRLTVLTVLAVRRGGFLRLVGTAIFRGGRFPAVGDVPARAFEDDADGVEHLSQLALTLRALGQRGLADALESVEPVAARVAAVGVRRHVKIDSWGHTKGNSVMSSIVARRGNRHKVSKLNLWQSPAKPARHSA